MPPVRRRAKNIALQARRQADLTRINNSVTPAAPAASSTPQQPLYRLEHDETERQQQHLFSSCASSSSCPPPISSIMETPPLIFHSDAAVGAAPPPPPLPPLQQQSHHSQPHNSSVPSNAATASTTQYRERNDQQYHNNDEGVGNNNEELVVALSCVGGGKKLGLAWAHHLQTPTSQQQFSSSSSSSSLEVVSATQFSITNLQSSSKNSTATVMKDLLQHQEEQQSNGMAMNNAEQADQQQLLAETNANPDGDDAATTAAAACSEHELTNLPLFRALSSFLRHVLIKKFATTAAEDDEQGEAFAGGGAQQDIGRTLQVHWLIPSRSLKVITDTLRVLGKTPLELPAAMMMLGAGAPINRTSGSNNANTNTNNIFVNISCRVTFLPVREFNPDLATDDRLSFHFPSSSLLLSSSHNNHSFNFQQEHHQQTAVRSALGGFLGFFERCYCGSSLQQQQQQQQHLLVPPQPSSASSLSKIFAALHFEPPHCISRIVHVPAATNIGLQLAWLEAHPAAHQELGRGKEGLSLLSLVCSRCSPVGRGMMRSWFCAPTSDLLVLQQRHDAVEFLVQSANRQELEAMIAAVQRFRDPVPVLRRVARGQQTTLKHWQGLVHACNSLLQLAAIHNSIVSSAANDVAAGQQQRRHNSNNRHNIINENHGVSHFLHRISSRVNVQKLRELEQLIRHVVDFSSTAEASTGQLQRTNHNTNAHQPQSGATTTTSLSSSSSAVRIRSGVDPTLDSFRETYSSLDNFLTLVAQKESAALASALDAFYERKSHHHPNQNNNHNHHQLAPPPPPAPAPSPPPPLSVTFLPQAGFMIQLQLSSIAAAGGYAAVVPAGYELALTTSDSAYFKSDTMRQLDSEVGDVHAAAVKAEADVCHRLHEQVLDLGRSSGIVGVASSVAELDCIIAFAAKALEEGWNRPQLVDRPGVVSLRNATHPLLSRLMVMTPSPAQQEQQQHHHQRQQHNAAPVPCPCIELGAAINNNQNDGYDEATATKSIVITGPNGSGKSVLTRTVGVCVFLASIGSFIPADATSIVGVFDAILTNDCVRSTSSLSSLSSSSSSSSLTSACFSTFARRGDDDDDEQRGGDNIGTNAARRDHHVNIIPPVLRSSFGEEVSQVAAALRSCTAASLLLLDEFGSGTLAEDGVALLGGILVHCAQLPAAQRPSLIATTHFTELMTSCGDILRCPPGPGGKCFTWLTMSCCSTTTITDNNNDDSAADDDVFLFVPQLGSLHRASKSALRVAARVGLPASVVQSMSRELLQAR